MLHVTWIIIQVIKIFLKTTENANANGSRNSLKKKKSFVYNFQIFAIRSCFMQIYTESLEFWSNNSGILCFARACHKTPWCWALAEREWILCAWKGVLSSISCASQLIGVTQVVARIHRNTFVPAQEKLPSEAAISKKLKN